MAGGEPLLSPGLARTSPGVPEFRRLITSHQPFQPTRSVLVMPTFPVQPVRLAELVHREHRRGLTRFFGSAAMADDTLQRLRLYWRLGLGTWMLSPSIRIVGLHRAGGNRLGCANCWC